MPISGPKLYDSISNYEVRSDNSNAESGFFSDDAILELCIARVYHWLILDEMIANYVRRDNNSLHGITAKNLKNQFAEFGVSMDNACSEFSVAINYAF